VTSAPRLDPVLDFIVHALAAHAVGAVIAAAFMLAERLS
jgi:hypothetical protein